MKNPLMAAPQVNVCMGKRSSVSLETICEGPLMRTMRCSNATMDYCSLDKATIAHLNIDARVTLPPRAIKFHLSATASVEAAIFLCSDLTAICVMFRQKKSASSAISMRKYNAGVLHF